MNILIIAAHPDDEVLGMGGTIHKMSKHHQIWLCVVTEGATAQYEDKKMIQVRKKSCEASGKILGISEIKFLEFTDMRLDSIPQIEINKKLEGIIHEFKPEVVFTTPYTDFNKDHQIVFDCTLVSTRTFKTKVKEISCYELPGKTKNQFKANTYVDISNDLRYKLKAFKKYHSEIEEFPHSRSFEAIENLAVQRGIESGLKYAEAFELIQKNIE